MQKKKIIVGVSGGVDSAVALYLLKQQGYDVTAVTMEIYKGKPLSSVLKGNSCYGAEKKDLNDIKELCEKIGVPYYIFDCSSEFQEQVLAHFKNEYMQGRTPNPCILCNQYIKFGALPKKAAENGIKFDYFATGHYVRATKIKDTYYLSRPLDLIKDQTYFLWRLSQEQLSKVKFPLGDLTKEQVRGIAAKIYGNLSEKKDSSDFYGGDYSDILQTENKVGEIIDTKGNVLGFHEGFWHYTLGQRKGLGIAHAYPLYVTSLDAANNQVIVGDIDSVKVNRVSVSDFVFRPFSNTQIYGKVRSTQKPVAVSNILQDGNSAVILFAEKMLLPAPSQSVVLYQDNTVIGGGLVAHS